MKKLSTKKLVYNASEYTYDSRKFSTIRMFGRDIYDDKISLEEADEDQSDLADEIENFINKTRLKSLEKKTRKKIVASNLHNFFVAREKVLNGFKSKIFLIESKGSGILNTKLKILTPKQMPQRLPIALAQVKAGNHSENLLNEIRQVVYSLYQPKEITKKVYNNIMKSI